MALVLSLIFSLAALLAVVLRKLVSNHRRKHPISVNYHFTRRCNKSCGFCFHTATTSYKESAERAKEGLRLLQMSGMRKLNFAGGEPFLYQKFLGEMVKFCKEELKLESVSIVTNGSLVTERFLAKFGRHIDILAVSCDSFKESTNIEIGRGSGNQVDQLYRIRNWCSRYNVKFKINTVVCKLNYTEDMNRHIEKLSPFRWKCFQVLLVSGENESAERLRDVRRFLITDEEYRVFCERHKCQKCFVPESNQVMAKSYLILDEYLRFLDRDGRQPSASILEVGVEKALASVYWDEESFHARGGVYDWSRELQPASQSVTAMDW